MYWHRTSVLLLVNGEVVGIEEAISPSPQQQWQPLYGKGGHFFDSPSPGKDLRLKQNSDENRMEIIWSLTYHVHEHSTR